MEDQELKLIITAKQSNERITPAQEAAQSLELRRLLQIWDQLTVSDGVLYRLFLDTTQPSGTRYNLWFHDACKIKSSKKFMKVQWVDT